MYTYIYVQYLCNQLCFAKCNCQSYADFVVIKISTELCIMVGALYSWQD